MTSVLRQAISNVRNLFFPARENEDSRRAEGSSNAASSFPSSSLKHFSGTKRQHDDVEAELTEDDDDYLVSKRLKVDQGVYYRKKPSPLSNRLLKRPALAVFNFLQVFCKTVRLKLQAASDLFFDASYEEEEDVEMQENIDNSSKNDDTQLAPHDLLILSESIVGKGRGRSRSFNSLALQQTSSPYSQKSSLQNLSKDFKDGQNQQIEIEKERMQIIQNESKMEQALHEAYRKKLVCTESIELEDPLFTLPEITEEMKAIIHLAMRPGRDSDVLEQLFNVEITCGDIKTLAPGKWLNDNVINAYMKLIADRSKNGKYPRCHIFTTYFYPTYLKEGYSNAMKRWTRKVDIFAYDLLIFPIHLGTHWCLAIADLRNKTLKYYDSLGGRNDKCLRALMQYMSHEMKERNNLVLDTTQWILENVKRIPKQENGSDCGMFTCKFAECLSREAEFHFIKQQNMNYYRERMIYELLKKDLMHP